MVITGTYDLTVNPFWKNVQQQEVYLECDTFSGPVTINLFPIANLNRFWNVKINIVDLSQNCSINNITINTGSVGIPPVQDTVDQLGNTQIILNKNGESVIFSVVSENQWLAGESITIPFAVQSVTGLNTDNTDPLNPIVKVSLANNTITGQGTPASPLVSNVVINTSQIISGTSGRVLFNKSNSVSESSDFEFDDVNVVLSLGGTTSGTKGRLNIKALNASASSFSIAIRKSDDSGYLFQTLNDGKIRINDTFNITNSDGTAGQSLVTDGAGNVSFQSKQDPISLTTTGNSGASSFASNVLNVPEYTLSGLGGVPTSRTLTINGTTQDLSADRTWTIPIGITVGTTPSSGTDGRVFFQAGGVVQQNANLFWDNTNNTLGIGTSTPSSSFKLDVNGDARFNGGATSSSGTQILNVGIRILTNAGNSGGISLDSNLPVANRLNFNSNFTIRSNSSITSGVDISLFTNSVQNSTNTVSLAGISGNVFSTSGGNNQTNGLLINPTINLNAGNVSTIFRGIHYNPTLTSTTGLTHRAIETTTGDVIFGSTSGNVAIGSTSPGARLDVRAQGALSTDIAFRVRNSADTLDILQVRGDTRIIQNVNANTALSRAGYNVLGENTDVWSRVATTGNQPRVTGFSTQGQVESISMFVESGATTVTGVGGSHVWFAQTGYGYFGSIGGNSLGFKFGTTTGSVLSNSNGTLAMLSISNNNYNQSVFALGTYLGTTNTQPSATYGGNTFFIKNGTAPTATATDTFALYSADITAGNAAPHFITENGNIIKLYRETTAVAAATLVSGLGTPLTNTDTFDGYTLQQVVKVLKNLGILQ